MNNKTYCFVISAICLWSCWFIFFSLLILDDNLKDMEKTKRMTINRRENCRDDSRNWS